jgi:hypothetical protein
MPREQLSSITFEHNGLHTWIPISTTLLEFVAVAEKKTILKRLAQYKDHQKSLVGAKISAKAH